MDSVFPLVSLTHVCPQAWPLRTRVCVLVRAEEDDRVTQQLLAHNRTEHASHCRRSRWALCGALSKRRTRGRQAGSCGSATRAGLASHRSPRPATLHRLHHQGALRGRTAGGARGLGRARTPPRAPSPAAAAAPSQRSRRGRYSFSALQDERQRPLPSQRHCTTFWHPLFKVGVSAPGAVSDFGVTSSCWLPPPPPP